MKKIVKPAIFLGLVLFQLGIVSYEVSKGVRKGTVFTLEVGSYDPYDPLRGRYLNLSFPEALQKTGDFRELEKVRSEARTDLDRVYVTFYDRGDAPSAVKNITIEKPAANERPFVKARIVYINDERVRLKFPFERFYIREDYALIAEKVIRDRSNTCLLVVETDSRGNGKIKELLVSGVPINKYIKELKKSEKE